MFIIQCLDHEDGSGALWFDLKCNPFVDKDEARAKIRHYREQDEIDGNLYSYRITEKGSELYYSQPTDRLEY